MHCSAPVPCGLGLPQLHLHLYSSRSAAAHSSGSLDSHPSMRIARMWHNCGVQRGPLPMRAAASGFTRSRSAMCPFNKCQACFRKVFASLSLSFRACLPRRSRTCAGSRASRRSRHEAAHEVALDPLQHRAERIEIWLLAESCEFCPQGGHVRRPSSVDPLSLGTLGQHARYKQTRGVQHGRSDSPANLTHKMRTWPARSKHSPSTDSASAPHGTREQTPAAAPACHGPPRDLTPSPKMTAKSFKRYLRSGKRVDLPSACGIMSKFQSPNSTI